MAAQINKDTVIGDLLNIDITTAPILMAYGMHCVCCPSAIGETLAEACFVHGIDDDTVDEIVDTINTFLANKEEL